MKLLVVPGIGTIHGFWASSQARAIFSSRCCLLSFCDFAQQINQRLIRFSSFLGKARDDVAEIGTVELRIFVDLAREEALPQGLNGTNRISSSSRAGNSSTSGRLHHSEYSL